MCCTCSNALVGSQGIGTVNQCTAVLAAERTTVDRDVVVEAWGIRQAVSALSTTVVSNRYRVGYGVSTVAVCGSCSEVFHHSDIRKVATSII